MQIEIATPDGSCPAHELRPTTPGPWPAVLVYIDGIGMRPAMLAIAERIAAHGYYVLMPDLFYRLGPYEAPDPKALFANPEVRTAWFAKAFSVINSANTMRDTGAFLAHIDAQPDVVRGKLGTTGYCMGARMSVTAAGTFGDRIAACAGYHPGGLATDAADSPHLLAANIKARVYIAGAIEDANFDQAQQTRLREALDAAHVRYELVEYPAKHGWVPTDTPIHDPVQAERHFTSMFALFDSVLR